MSRRFGRMLLRLYPSRMRQRYGDELLDLQDSLRSEGELSLLRLTRDAIAGAMVVRSGTQRALILVGGLLLAGLIAAGVTVVANGGGRYGTLKHPAVARLAATPRVRPSVPYGRTCLVGGGMSCSLRACSEFTASVAVRETPSPETKALYPRDSRRGKAICVSHISPLRHAPQTQYVTGSGLFAEPSNQARRGPAPKTA